MNFSLFFMIVVVLVCTFGIKKLYNAILRLQKQMDFEESCKNKKLTETLKGKKK